MYALQSGETTHILHNDRVVLDETARRTEEDNATISGVRDHVASDDAVGTAKTDTVSPLLERVRATWTNVIVLNHYARAGKRPFGDVKTRPRAGVKRVNIFNLKRSCSDLRIGYVKNLRTSCPELPPPNSILAPPLVGGAPALVPLIWEASLSFILKTRSFSLIRTYLDIPQFHATASVASPVHSGRVPCPVEHRSIHNQSRPLISCGVSLGRNFLVRGGEVYGLSDKVLFARAQAEHVSVPSISEKLLEPFCDGVRWVRAYTGHGYLWKRKWRGDGKVGSQSLRGGLETGKRLGKEKREGDDGRRKQSSGAKSGPGRPAHVTWQVGMTGRTNDDWLRALRFSVLFLCTSVVAFV